MAIHYYDDILVEKLARWLPESSRVRVLHPDESKKLFELQADDNRDKALSLPLIALSRRDDLDLLSTVKSPKSYDGLRIINSDDTGTPIGTHKFNVLPIRPEYQLDIYTKKAEECEEYVRSFLFKLINNPTLKIKIPYQNLQIEHIAYVRILSPVSNTSNITERLFSGQFTRWTIQLELHDAFLFSIPYRKNWQFSDEEGELIVHETKVDDMTPELITRERLY